MVSDGSMLLLKGRLDGTQKNRLARLLDMLYRPSEIAEEIGFNVRQVYRVYIPAGCPIVKDNDNQTWINGKAFREWIHLVYKKCELKPNQAFCLTCKKPVPMQKPERCQEGRLFFFICICPYCSRKLARIITRGKPLK